MRPDPRAAAAEIWRVRERTERQVSALFASLAQDLQAQAVDERLVEMASRAADDEQRHARLCASLIDRFGGDGVDRTAAPRIQLGPRDLPAERRALYASVALSCVTETLSTALLLEIRERASDPAVTSVVREILRDEVDHAKIGWAHLAFAARRRSVAWLAPHIQGMFDAATASGSESAMDQSVRPDLAGYGILPRAEVRAVLGAVTADVILPGLARYGIAAPETAAARGGHRRQRC